MAVYPDPIKSKKSDRLCLFAHYDTNGRIHRHVLYYMEMLAMEGFDIVLISTSENLDDSDIKKALEYCRGIIKRKNIGLDFASWKAAMEFVPDVWEYDRLLLTNDSIFGPFRPLKGIFESFERSSAHFCGLTDCRQEEHHLQSYFLYFKKELFNNPAFADFWRTVGIRHIKREIVEKYEIGLSRKLSSSGLELSAIFQYDEIMKDILSDLSAFQYRKELQKRPLNPTLHLWDVLLEKHGFPFIKTDVLKNNRFKSPAVGEWQKLVPETGKGIVPAIKDYLESFHH